MPHLKPVGHQSTNWIVRLVLIVATAAFTSFGTTSPWSCQEKGLGISPWAPCSYFGCKRKGIGCPGSMSQPSRCKEYIISGWKLTDLRLSFHDTSCSRPCTCRDEDRTSPSSRLARRRTWWSLPQKAAHGMPSPRRWLEHRRSTWSGCADKAPNWFEIWQLSLVKKTKT